MMNYMTTEHELTEVASELGRLITRLELTAGSIHPFLASELARMASESAARLAALLRETPHGTPWTLDRTLPQGSLDIVGEALATPIPDHLPDLED